MNILCKRTKMKIKPRTKKWSRAYSENVSTFREWFSAEITWKLPIRLSVISNNVLINQTDEKLLTKFSSAWKFLRKLGTVSNGTKFFQPSRRYLIRKVASKIYRRNRPRWVPTTYLIFERRGRVKFSSRKKIIIYL